jgi:SAM-dependent methyltransferase
MQKQQQQKRLDPAGRHRSRQPAQLPQDSAETASAGSPQESSRRQASREARAAIKVLQGHRIVRGPVLDLCCGLGRQAEVVARAGYDVTGVDIRQDMAVQSAWAVAAARQSHLRFVSADVLDLPLRGPFAAALLLHNSLALFHRNEDAIRLLREIRRVLTARGVLVMENVCVTLWREIAAGRYADGISEDGLWQMIWLPGRNVFALRYGDQVRPGCRRIGLHETLYRAWSLEEMDLLCRLAGWKIDHASAAKPLLVARPG